MYVCFVLFFGDVWLSDGVLQDKLSWLQTINWLDFSQWYIAKGRLQNIKVSATQI